MSPPRGPRGRAAADKAAVAQRWVARLAGREVSEADLKAFEAWLGADPGHRAAFDRERAVWLDIGRLEPFERLALVPEPSRRRARSKAPALAAAAAVLAVVFAADSWTRFASDFSAPEGRIETAALPDGSQAVLDSGAALAVDYRPGVRRVRLLRGRAWFEVRKDPARPFLVEAGDLSARAVGTAYAVTRSKAGGEVVVTRGVVAATGPGDARAVLLGAGQARAYAGGAGRTQAARPGAEAWRGGHIVLDGLTVPEALAEIDRYRPGRLIVIGVPAGRRINAELHVSSLDQGLTALARTEGLDLRRIAPGVTLVTRTSAKAHVGS